MLYPVDTALTDNGLQFTAPGVGGSTVPLVKGTPAKGEPFRARDFAKARNFGPRLKALKGFTPYEFICKAWAKESQSVTFNPLHQMPLLDI